MRLEQFLPANVYNTDRPLHHGLALEAYRASFRFGGLTEKYELTEFRRLADVFNLVLIGDLDLPTVKRPVDTFDLTNPYQAAKIRDACYRDLPSKSRAIACLKAIDRYCHFLKDNPTVYLPGQKPLYLPELYGPIESPVNRYTIPRQSSERTPNRNYLEASEYRHWLRFTWSLIRPDLRKDKLLKAAQLYLMCVIAGEMGLRLKEILGLQPEHFNLVDNVCIVLKGKGSHGSGDRKRAVPISPLVKATLEDFLQRFPRTSGRPLFQNPQGQCLSMNTAHHWMDELIVKMHEAKVPILTDKGFGWHAFRRTRTRSYLANGGNIHDLKRIMGWSYTSTISHYLGDSKQEYQPSGPPLYGGNGGHGG